MPDRKVRSNKGKTRGPYKARSGPAKPGKHSKVLTKCVIAFRQKTLSFSKYGSPYLKTKAGNRYSCKSQLKKKGLAKPPSVHPSQFKKGTIRNGYVIKYVSTVLGKKKVWRKIP